MIFDIDDITERGLDFDLIVESNCFDIDHSDYNLISDVRVQGFLSRVNREIYLEGRIKTELKISCSRCLEFVDYPVVTEVLSRFLPFGAENEPMLDQEIRKSEVDTEYYGENRIDISRSVQDAILLDVPMVGLCRKACLGLCHLCGNNLNINSCQCLRPEEIDPRLEILNKIKEKMD